MAMTLNEVKEYIDLVGGDITLEKQDGSDAILAFEKYNNILETKNKYGIFLVEDGEMFQIYNSIGAIEDLGFSQGDLAKTLLDHNDQTKFGTWEIDKEDGHIKYAVEIPLEDNTLTEKQFKRIVNASEQSTIELLKMVRELHQESSDGI